MKNEKEKMLSGELYDASDPILTIERVNCRKSTSEFNNPSTSTDMRNAIIKKLFGKIGQTFTIEPNFHCDYGYNIHVGENFYSNFGCILLDVNRITIGDNVLMGPNVQIYTAGHPVDPKLRLSSLEFGLPITIGNNVWIGGSAIICPGITIGDNVTIGAGSVVTKDIMDNVIAVGNPAKIIKTL